MKPRYPIYIISKGRWEQRLTARALDQMGVPFRVVVEPQEADRYAAVLGAERLLVLPFSNLGQGSIPARNWVWDHATEEGHARHWIMDDNIKRFRRFHRDKRTPIANGAGFRAMEAFVDRYENVPMAGPQYTMFAVTDLTSCHDEPVKFNTRVYSCILLSNAPEHRLMWRGRYNEDTDLSLRYLKAGYCTALFYAFLCDKEATMTMKGGNTDELYKQGAAFDGRLAMARSLQLQHPDVVKVTRKWGRWQHHVDYRPFKGNRLIRRPGVEIPEGVNDFGMRLLPAQQIQHSRA
jgi:hypothetical protein